MNRYTTLAVVSAGLSMGMAVLSAAMPAIGVAMSEGTILVNDTQTPGNTTIFSGTTLQTQRASSQVRLKDGAQVSFDADSRGKVFTDHVDLQQGSARISRYSAIANGLSIRADADSSASITMKGEAVEVAALTGDVHVFNAAGLNVANILPGRALDLRPQGAGANAPTSLVGCPVKSGNDFLLTDETSNVTAQLRGGNVKARQHVRVTGTLVSGATPVSSATQVIAVTALTSAPGSCSGAGGAATAGASAGAGAGAPAGIVFTPVVIGVVVVSAAATVVVVGTLYANGTIGGGAACISTSAQPCPQ